MHTPHVFYIVKAKPFLMRSTCQVPYLFRSVEDTKTFTNTKEAIDFAWDFLENYGNIFAKAFSYLAFIVKWERMSYTIDEENLQVLLARYKELGHTSVIRSY